MQVDDSGWTGDGDFTRRLIDALRSMPGIARLRVENAPATRSGADYQLLSNEVFVAFAGRRRWRVTRRFRVVPWPRRLHEPVMTLGDLRAALAALAEIGDPDYADEGLLQYLRAERIVAPYQTRGFKLVEMVRLYEIGRA